MDQYEAFLVELNNKFSLDLTGYKRPQMERRINTLMRTLGVSSYIEYIKLMQQDNDQFNKFVNHLTINVSEFFRNPSQWDVLKEKIIPKLIQNSNKLKIWSAGCSTGEEPYTLAMLLRENFPRVDISILASDIDGKVLKTAKEGIYSAKASSGIPNNYLNKYLTSIHDSYEIKSELKRLINFKKQNLIKDQFEKDFDLILCRNVVIYFTEETKFLLYKKFFSALKPQGILFTGSTEQIIQAREIGFESAAIFFYQRP